MREFRDEAVSALADAVLEGQTTACLAAERLIKRIDGIASARFTDWKVISYGLH